MIGPHSSPFAWPVAAVVAGALVAGALGACQSNGDVEVERSLVPVDLVRGSTSGVMERGVRVMRTQAEFDALWEEHTRLVHPTPPMPPVDFESSMVVAVFMGECMSGGHAVQIDEVVTVPEHDDQPAGVVVRVTESSPGPDELATMAITSPFHFVVVERAAGDASLRPAGQGDR